MQLNFHDKLKYLSTALDDNELMEIIQIAYSPDFVIKDSDLTQRVERIGISLQNFLEANESQLNECDLDALKDLQVLVHNFNSNFQSQPEKLGALEKTIAVSIHLIFNKLHLPNDLEKIRRIPSPYAQNYVLAELLNRDPIAIKDLNLTKEELMSLGPYLTFLDCRDAFEGWDCNEIDNFLKTCSNLKYLYINHPLIEQLPLLPVCQVLDCSNCRNLKKITMLPLCQQLTSKRCPSLEARGVSEQLKRGFCKERAKEVDEACIMCGVLHTEYSNFITKHKGASPLKMAVIDNNDKMLSVLHELGADMNEYVEGYSLLWWAMSSQKTEMVGFLIVLGADVNKHYKDNDKNGTSLLEWATSIPDYKIVELLIRFNADVNQCDKNGRSPLMLAKQENQPGIAKLLIDHKADEEYANEAIFRIFLAHIWGLEGTSKLIDAKGVSHDLRLEGSRSPYIMTMLSWYVSEFFKLDKVADLQVSSLISERDKLEIQESIANAVPLSSKSNRELIKSDKPLVILAGLVNHRISIVIHKGRLVVFNRGHGKKNNTAETYLLPKEKVTEKMISDLATDYNDIKKFDSVISGLQLSPLTEEDFTQQDQKVGNCAWASAKGAFEVLCVLCTKDFTDKKINIEIGRKIYKYFSYFVRKEFLNFYLKESKNIDIEMIKKIVEKCFKKGEHSKLFSSYFTELIDQLHQLNLNWMLEFEREKT